ncbi:MAG: ribbon-helix-helix domain-containing protein [Chloroflexota bacterium]|nr:ribbon-helix-helix domain-containing protein [Chloroflexota bacterium]
METTKVAISIDRKILERIDRLVKEQVFPSRSRAIQEAVEEKLQRLEYSRLSRECSKLEPVEEQAIAEEGLSEEFGEWPEY